MTRPSVGQKDAEIVLLEEIKGRVPRSITKGYIDAVILTVRERLDSNKIHDRWGDDSDDPDMEKLMAALDARDWCEGLQENPPSREWAELIPDADEQC